MSNFLCLKPYLIWDMLRHFINANNNLFPLIIVERKKKNLGGYAVGFLCIKIRHKE